MSVDGAGHRVGGARPFDRVRCNEAPCPACHPVGFLSRMWWVVACLEPCGQSTLGIVR